MPLLAMPVVDDHGTSGIWGDHIADEEYGDEEYGPT